MSATFSGIVRDRPAYTIGPRFIRHEVLIESEPDGSVEGGDSGSAVVSEDGTTLLGMHVAGTEGVSPPLAYMIPAARLFDAGQYTGVNGPETWSLVPAP